jgi:hypothetical protein
MPRTLIVGTGRTKPGEPIAETETLIVETDYEGIVRLELDDGHILDVDRTELEAALRAAA